MGENNKNNKKISVGTLIAAVCLILGVATAMAALMGTIYCSKAELATVKAEVKDDMGRVKLKVAETGWEIRTISTRVQNIEKRQIQMGENITKLLDRLRVRPVDPPYLKPLPRPPDLLDGSPE